MPLESDIEREFARWVKAQGGLCIKQNPAWYVNIPDRFVVAPGGYCAFIEFKRPGGRIREGQKKFARRLNERNIPAYFVDNVEDAKRIYENIAALSE